MYYIVTYWFCVESMWEKKHFVCRSFKGASDFVKQYERDWKSHFRFISIECI